ncbi:uncharacterized protein [Chelonus insularis]|uniref:uncharacterized protein isoform X2 n=1 Tax=Chelonus insularis TaxID=460826 RepID=UPI00158B528B|nr:uncharacterized protein LOC118065961 isoform X2 [Chelonus insularis]
MLQRLKIFIRPKNRWRLFCNEKKSSPEIFFTRDIAFESEYFYKQNKELRELLKHKIEEEVEKLRIDIKSMQKKIIEYEKDIRDNLKLLEELEDNPKSSVK